MTARVQSETKSRQKLAAENVNKVQRLHRALQSGPLKSDLRTVSESIHAARALYKQIEMEGIDPKDFWVHVAYLTPDLSALFTQTFTPGQEAAIQSELSGQGRCCIVVGLAFGIRDWERGNWLLGARPFLRTPLVLMAFDNWMEEMLQINA
jgi:hypothetical protein